MKRSIVIVALICLVGAVLPALVTNSARATLDNPAQFEGIGVAAWVMPVFALLIGLLVVVHFTNQWVSRHRILPGGPVVGVDRRVRERIENDLENLEQ